MSFRIVAVLVCAAACKAAQTPVNYIGKSKDQIRFEASNLEHLILNSEPVDAASFRYNVRMYIMGCLMSVSSEPYIKGTIITPDTRFGDIATIFLSDVSYCASSLRNMGNQLNKEGKYGEAVVVKENVVALNDLDFLSSPDTQITNAIQGCIDLGMLCFSVGNYECSKSAFAKAANTMSANNVENDELCSLITKVAASQYKAGNFSEAAESYHQALRHLKRLGSANKDLIGSVTTSLAATMFQQKNYGDAENTYRTALDVFKSAPNKNFKLVAVATKNLASAVFAQRMWLDAAALYEEALALFVSMVNDSDPDPQFHSTEFNGLLDTVAISLSNAADDAAKRGNYREAHSLRERAAEANKLWSNRGQETQKSGPFLENLFKKSGISAGAQSSSGGSGVIRMTIVWTFRAIFAAAVGLLIYIAVVLVDWSKSLPEQFDRIKLQLFSLVDFKTPEENVNGSVNHIVDAQERFSYASNGGSAQPRNKAAVAPSPDRYFSRPVPAVISPPRQQKPVFIPSE